MCSQLPTVWHVAHLSPRHRGQLTPHSIDGGTIIAIIPQSGHLKKKLPIAAAPVSLPSLCRPSGRENDQHVLCGMTAMPLKGLGKQPCVINIVERSRHQGPISIGRIAHSSNFEENEQADKKCKTT